MLDASTLPIILKIISVYNKRQQELIITNLSLTLDDSKYDFRFTLGFAITIMYFISIAFSMDSKG